MILCMFGPLKSRLANAHPAHYAHPNLLLVGETFLSKEYVERMSTEPVNFKAISTWEISLLGNPGSRMKCSLKVSYFWEWVFHIFIDKKPL